jgi:hypothetical protein
MKDEQRRKNAQLRSSFILHPSSLQGFLFRLTIGGAVILIVVVFAAPLLDNGSPAAHGWSRLLTLFARDATLRRTTLASSVGLIVTACVFFRPPGGLRLRMRKPKPTQPPPPPPTVVGA